MRSCLEAPAYETMMRAIAKISRLSSLITMVVIGCSQPENSSFQPPAFDLAGVDRAIAAAIERAAQGVHNAPQSAEAWGTLGMILHIHEFDAQAADCFEAAASLDGNNPRWPYFHARCLYKTQPQSAIALLEQAVQICRDEPPAPRLFLVEILLEQGMLDEAEQQLQAFMARRSDHARARHAKARLLFMRNQPEACKQAIEGFLSDVQRKYDQQVAQARALGKTNPQAEARAIQVAKAWRDQQGKKQKTLALLLAAAMRRTGEVEEAETLAEQAKAFSDLAWDDPYLDEASKFATGKKHFLNQADLAFGRGDYDRSISILNDVLRDYPDEPFAYIFLGRAYNRQGVIARNKGDTVAANALFHRAHLALTQALERGGNNVDALFRLAFAVTNIAELEGDKERLVEAEKYYREAIQLKPDFTRAHFNLGDCLYKQGKRRDAADAMREAIRIDPEYVEARVALGIMLYQQNELAESKEHLETALQLSPENAPARDYLQRISALEQGSE